jgi:hypothetical protein
MPDPPGQGEYPHCREQSPHINRIRNNPAQKTKRHKCLCLHCKMSVLHKAKNYVKVEANKDKHWPGWKLVHTIA